jgi:hypothetical protein
VAQLKLEPNSPRKISDRYKRLRRKRRMANALTMTLATLLVILGMLWVVGCVVAVWALIFKILMK